MSKPTIDHWRVRITISTASIYLASTTEPVVHLEPDGKFKSVFNRVLVKGDDGWYRKS